MRVLIDSWHGLGFKLSSLSNCKFLSIDTSSSADRSISGYLCFLVHSILHFFLGGDSDSLDDFLLTFCVRVYKNHFQESYNNINYKLKRFLLTSELSSPKNLNFVCNALDTNKQSSMDGLILWHIITVASVCTIYFLSPSVSIFFLSLSLVSRQKHGIGNGLGSI